MMNQTTVNGWTAYTVTIQRKRTTFTWVRFAPNTEHLIAGVEQAIRDEARNDERWEKAVITSVKAA